jgi:ketosteroid isomerase-like protein
VIPSSGDIVDEFIRAYVRRDADAALELVTDDFVFEHIPMPESTIVRGKEQLRGRIMGAIAAAERVDWKILHQVDGGDVVMNEASTTSPFPKEVRADAHLHARRRCVRASRREDRGVARLLRSEDRLARPGRHRPRRIRAEPRDREVN